MGWKTNETIRNKAQKFKEDYSRLFDERHESMKRIVDVVVPYMKQEHLWEDREAILNVICVLPGCHFRFYMYSHYYEITDKPHEIITNPDCGVWKVDREILLKIQDFADDYEEKELSLQRMEDSAKKEIITYLEETGLWNDLQAVHEIRCCLPICLLQSKLDDRYRELFMKESGVDGE